MENNNSETKTGYFFIHKMYAGFLGFFIGATFLAACSTLQKLSIGAPLVINGYIVPILFGGTTGFFINSWRFKLKDAYKALNEMNHDLEAKVTGRTKELEKIVKELKESESRYETLFNTISDAVYIHDSEGQILNVNIAAYENLGYTKDEILKLYASDIDVDYSDKEMVRKTISPAITVPLRIESRHRTKDNSILNVELNMHTFHEKGKDVFVTVARDITEQKQFLHKLKKGEEKLRYILDSLPDMILEVDSNMRIIWANKAASDLNKDALGEFCYEAYPGRKNICDECYCAKAFKSGKMEAGVMYQAKSKTAGESYWENLGIPIDNKDGKEMTVLEVSRNVTGRVKVEKEKEKLIKQLESALKDVKKLSGLLPICSHCKKIRDDKGYWNSIESYIHEHSEAEFSHSICQECAKKYYPDYDIYEE